LEQVQAAFNDVLEQGRFTPLWDSFGADAESYRAWIDEDLTAMYLTDRKNDVRRQLSDHEELELLLETFSKQVEEMVNEAENIHVRGSF
jgi:hypothetical protein